MNWKAGKQNIPSIRISPYLSEKAKNLYLACIGNNAEKIFDPSSGGNGIKLKIAKLILTRAIKANIFVRFINNSGVIIDDVLDEELNDKIEILTIKLVVDKNLEPKWFVINSRSRQQPIEILANDRASLNVFLVSDYIWKL